MKQTAVRKVPWGVSSSIDLKLCDPKKIRDEKCISTFSRELCKLIKMRPYGDPVIVNFGENANVSGFTLVQLIETSSVTAHFANKSNAIYLDVFSCKVFEPKVVAEFSKSFFNAESYVMNTVERY